MKIIAGIVFFIILIAAIVGLGRLFKSGGCSGGSCGGCR